MTLIILDRIVRVVALDEKVYSEIAEGKGVLVQAIIVVLLASVIGGVWTIIVSEKLFFFFIPGLALPGWFIVTGIMHIVAKLLGGKADFVSYLKAIGFARVPGVLGIILSIGWLIGPIWVFACYLTATKVVHRLSTGKAVIAAVIVPITLMVLIIWMRIEVCSALKTIGITRIDAIKELPFLLLFSLL